MTHLSTAIVNMSLSEQSRMLKHSLELVAVAVAILTSERSMVHGLTR